MNAKVFLLFILTTLTGCFFVSQPKVNIKPNPPTNQATTISTCTGNNFKILLDDYSNGFFNAFYVNDSTFQIFNGSLLEITNGKIKKAKRTFFKKIKKFSETEYLCLYYDGLFITNNDLSLKKLITDAAWIKGFYNFDVLSDKTILFTHDGYREFTVKRIDQNGNTIKTYSFPGNATLIEDEILFYDNNSKYGHKFNFISGAETLIPYSPSTGSTDIYLAPSDSGFIVFKDNIIKRIKNDGSTAWYLSTQFTASGLTKINSNLYCYYAKENYIDKTFIFDSKGSLLTRVEEPGRNGVFPVNPSDYNAGFFIFCKNTVNYDQIIIQKININGKSCN